MSHYIIKETRGTIFFFVWGRSQRILSSSTSKVSNLDCLLVRFRHGHLEHTIRYYFFGQCFKISLRKPYVVAKFKLSYLTLMRMLSRYVVLNFQPCMFSIVQLYLKCNDSFGKINATLLKLSCGPACQCVKCGACRCAARALFLQYSPRGLSILIFPQRLY